MTAAFHHIPVLLDSVIGALSEAGGSRFLDGTLGGAGHASALLRATGPDSILIGIDRDPSARAAAALRLAEFGDRVFIRAGRYADMSTLAADHAPFDGILLDIGVSSPQLDHPERGFSLRSDGPLDMRMDPTTGESAAELLDQLDEDALTTILRDYGEEPRAKRIARAILAGRPWQGTLALADAVAKASGYRNSRTHPATRTFQALRIAVNDELRQLERGLDAAIALLAPRGRLAVISFHSLEDRLVKQRFRTLAAVGTPRDEYGHPRIPAQVRLITRKPIRGAKQEPHNPRSRSASLRIVERLG
ncbi:MAG: 16S rRNA (cytosine(1402)-N(4))-methyltransferase [Deltaproteobacteria bacterium]|nr:16S rRNA (cytosine(1402)-N(4))-methyltransferase [Deltaproteobacteria bacterium]HCH66020.1 16S rRNA (cytosine(1402)-N(4))-methyltransferase [Deltaproteobacteria bacterium]